LVCITTVGRIRITSAVHIRIITTLRISLYNYACNLASNNTFDVIDRGKRDEKSIFGAIRSDRRRTVR
jgi:hypothetical protein